MKNPVILLLISIFLNSAGVMIRINYNRNIGLVLIIAGLFMLVYALFIFFKHFQNQK